MVKVYMYGLMVVNMKGSGGMGNSMEKVKWYGQMDKNTRDSF
jgi:hypothetical protein